MGGDDVFDAERAHPENKRHVEYRAVEGIYDEEGHTIPTGIVVGFKSVAKGTIDAARALTQKNVTEEEFHRRQAICKACQAVDSEGIRLFRLILGKQPVCGKPRYLDLFDGIRNEHVDGCGCFLKAKWGKEGQTCPLGKW